MTALTRAVARNDICAQFKSVFQGSGALGENLLVVYDDHEVNAPPSVPASGQSNPPAWVRLTVLHDTEDMTGFTDTPARRYTVVGTVKAQIFTPYGTGLRLADDLAILAKNAFRGKRTTNGVIFYAVNARENGRDGEWFQNTVTATFTYDEVA